MVILIKEQEYEIIKDYGETISSLDLNDIVTDYYDIYDYIVGDWAYGKVRLKGFYESNHKLCKEHNNILNVEDYLHNKCAYGCKHFILKKVKINSQDQAD